eukprot:3941506-Rhodomonas_salina.2
MACTRTRRSSTQVPQAFEAFQPPFGTVEFEAKSNALLAFLAQIDLPKQIRFDFARGSTAPKGVELVLYDS